MVNHRPSSHRNRWLVATISLLTLLLPTRFSNAQPVRPSQPSILDREKGVLRVDRTVNSSRDALSLADAAPGSSATTQPTTLRDDPRYRRWQTALTWGLIILITFVTGAAAIVVFSRRFRRWIGREKKKPTPDEDVWAMHKLPEDEPHDDDLQDLN